MKLLKKLTGNKRCAVRRLIPIVESGCRRGLDVGQLLQIFAAPTGLQTLFVHLLAIGRCFYGLAAAELVLHIFVDLVVIFEEHLRKAPGRLRFLVEEMLGDLLYFGRAFAFLLLGIERVQLLTFRRLFGFFGVPGQGLQRQVVVDVRRHDELIKLHAT